MRVLPVSPAWRLAERAPELRWLVTHLWSQDAVGIGGGEPKCCKSILALDIAVAVAARAPLARPFGGAQPRPRPPQCRRGCPVNRGPAAGGHRRRCRPELA